MARAFRSVLAACAAVALTIPVIAHAVLCMSNGDCPTTPLGGGRTCIKQQIFGVEMFWGNCTAPGACNSGRDCIPQAECRLGVCQRPAGTCAAETDCADDERCSSGRCEANAPSGPGKGIPGEGKRCMPADGSKPADWAKDRNGKPLGACPNGTRCNANGYCVRLET